MQFTLHATRRTPHGASRLVQAISAWLVKTRRAPSRHSRDARVYGHTTKAMHKLSTPPPPPRLDVTVRALGQISPPVIGDQWSNDEGKKQTSTPPLPDVAVQV